MSIRRLRLIVRARQMILPACLWVVTLIVVAVALSN